MSSSKFPKPWFRKSRNQWYVQIDGVQRSLGPDKTEAFREYHRMMAAPPSERPTAPKGDNPLVYDPDPVVIAVVDQFLVWASVNYKRSTYEWYAWRLNSFAREIPPLLRSAELRQHHITAWFGKNPEWSNTYRNTCVRAVQRAFNWAVQEGYFNASPAARLTKPEPSVREFTFSETDIARMLAEIRGLEFRLFLRVMLATGCRPEQIRAVEARHFDPEKRTWILGPDVVGKPGTVYLPADVVALCRQLAIARPIGPLFRNSRGNPWTRNAVQLRMRSLREKLGLPRGAVSYALRHTYCTRALESGMDCVTVARLMGHKSLDMVMKVYAHLSDRHLAAEAERAAG